MSESSATIIDLTEEGNKSTLQNIKNSKKHSVNPTSQSSLKPAKIPKVANKDKAHVLLWICSHGKGQGKTWKKNALRVIGVYSSKENAERKKEQVMGNYGNYGHGDICVGDTWEDEIDLIVKPIEEVDL